MIKKRDIIFLIIVFIINIPLLFITTYRTDKEITLPGGFNTSSKVISINEANINGSYNTVYVMSFSHSTIFQNWICNLYDKAEVTDMLDITLHFSDYELYKMGEIEHHSSVMTSIISSYNEAMKYDDGIVLDYELKSVVVSFYLEGSDFRIGDEIVGINEFSISDSGFKDAFNNRKLNDVLKVIRDNEEIEIVLNEKNYQKFSFYPYYNLNDINPEVTIKRGNTNGPSGGLMRSLALVDSLLEYDFAKGRKIAGTGTIDIYGNVGEIGGIKQKIYTAYSNDCDIFFCPEENYSEALEVYNKLPGNKFKLIKVKHLSDALEVLYE